MGARKDHITGMERAQIVMEMLPAKRPYGTVTQLEQKYEVSRQTIYKIAEKGKTLLIQGMEPGRHGARIEEKSVRVNREHVERSTVVLTEAGVSQRDISICLEELLETRLSSSWVALRAHLAEVEKKAAAINQELKAIVEETLSGDEIYSNGKPNLLLVGNESLYIYCFDPSTDLRWRYLGVRFIGQSATSAVCQRCGVATCGRSRRSRSQSPPVGLGSLTSTAVGPGIRVCSFRGIGSSRGSISASTNYKTA